MDEGIIWDRLVLANCSLSRLTCGKRFCYLFWEPYLDTLSSNLDLWICWYSYSKIHSSSTYSSVWPPALWSNHAVLFRLRNCVCSHRWACEAHLDLALTVQLRKHLCFQCQHATQVLFGFDHLLVCCFNPKPNSKAQNFQTSFHLKCLLCTHQIFLISLSFYPFNLGYYCQLRLPSLAAIDHWYFTKHH